MVVVVYLLCAMTSVLCLVLLWRGYRETRHRLLLWSTLCFAGLALNNVLLFVDKVVATEIDLSVWRQVPAVVGLGALVYGLIWEPR